MPIRSVRFFVADRADLLREVRADERQVDLVDELVAHERREHARRELVDAQAALLALDDLRLAAGGTRGSARRARSTNGTSATEQLVDRERACVRFWMRGCEPRSPSTVVSTVAALGLALDAAIGDEHHRGLAHERARVLELLRADERVDIRERDAEALAATWRSSARSSSSNARRLPFSSRNVVSPRHSAVGRGAGDEARPARAASSSTR